MIFVWGLVTKYFHVSNVLGFPLEVKSCTGGCKVELGNRGKL